MWNFVTSQRDLRVHNHVFDIWPSDYPRYLLSMYVGIPYIGVHQTSIAILYEIHISRTRLLRTNFIHFGVQYAVSRHMGEAPVPSSMLFPDSCLKNLSNPNLNFVQNRNWGLVYTYTRNLPSTDSLQAWRNVGEDEAVPHLLQECVQAWFGK